MVLLSLDGRVGSHRVARGRLLKKVKIKLKSWKIFQCMKE